MLETVCTKFSVHHQLIGIKHDRFGIETEGIADAKDMALLLHQLSQKEEWNFHAALLGRVILGIDSVAVGTFQTFFIPLFAKLTSHLNSKPDQFRQHREFFRQSMQTFRVRCIRRKPAGDGNWACAPESFRCCKICIKLDDFLCNPSKEVERFPLSKTDRHHLHQCLNDSQHSHVTDRSTLPETLVVKKAPSPSLRTFQEWEARVKEGEKLLRAIDQDVLKDLLGEQIQS